MRLILLPGIDRVRIVDPSGRSVDGVESKHGPQSGDVAVAQIGNAKQRQRVIASVKDASTIEFELLAMFQPIEEAVAERAFHRGPGTCGGAHARRQCRVPVVGRQRNKRIQIRPQSVNRGKVQCVIAFAHVERAAVDLHALDDIGDIYVRIGIAVTVRIRRQVVRHQVRAHLNILRDRLAVIARHARRKILRRFDTARRGLDRVTGNGNRGARTSWVRIEQILGGKHFHRGIGRYDILFAHVGGHQNVFRCRRQLTHADCDLWIVVLLQGN